MLAPGLRVADRFQRPPGFRPQMASSTPMCQATSRYWLESPIGAVWARRPVLAIVDEQEVTVVALDTGEILSTHLIEPDRRYWRNQRRDPGRWPGSQAT